MEPSGQSVPPPLGVIFLHRLVTVNGPVHTGPRRNETAECDLEAGRSHHMQIEPNEHLLTVNEIELALARVRRIAANLLDKDDQRVIERYILDLEAELAAIRSASVDIC
jgi:hypothetical protein